MPLDGRAPVGGQCGSDGLERFGDVLKGGGDFGGELVSVHAGERARGGPQLLAADVTQTSNYTGSSHMAWAIIGFRRLFESVGCSLADGGELCVAGALGTRLRGEIYLGHQPVWGSSYPRSNSPYITPTGPIVTQTMVDAAAGDDPKPLLAETLIWRWANVPDDEFDAVRHGARRGGDGILRWVETEFGAVLRDACEVLSGILGLRMHRQFVLRELSTTFFAVCDGVPVRSFYLPAVELLEGPTLNEVGSSELRQLLGVAASANEDTLLAAGNVFRWLRRAWPQIDHVTKFMDLFAVLEVLLGGVRVPIDPAMTAKRVRMEEILRDSGAPDRAALRSWLRDVASPRSPSLNSRFREMARDAAIPGWEADVEAFRALNSRRNAVLHEGEAGQAVDHVDVTEEDVRSLEDLAERYACLAIFGDERVYQSRYRRRSTAP